MNGVFIHIELGLLTPFGRAKLSDLFYSHIAMIHKTEIFYGDKILRFINCDTNVSSYQFFLLLLLVSVGVLSSTIANKSMAINILYDQS